MIQRYAKNGREAVNIIQISAGIALTENKNKINVEHVEWVVNTGQYVPRPEKKLTLNPQIGYANGLAVHGPNSGMIIEIEATTVPVEKGEGSVIVTGIVEEEEME